MANVAGVVIGAVILTVSLLHAVAAPRLFALYRSRWELLYGRAVAESFRVGMIRLAGILGVFLGVAMIVMGCVGLFV